MKKILLFSLAAIAVGMAFTSCTNNEEPLKQDSVSSSLQVSIPAMFVGNADTRALIDEGTVLKSVWTKDDKVFVYDKYYNLDPLTLSADASGAKANLVGELTADSYNVGDNILLAYGYESYQKRWFYYNPQKGTFDDVQKHDYSAATVEVTAVDAGKVETTEASFKPFQSIFKFTFKDESDNTVVVKKLDIKSDKVAHASSANPNETDSKGGVTVKPDSPLGELWVALRMDESIENDIITFEVEDNEGKLYVGTKAATADKPVNGKYYTSTVTLVNVGENSLKIEPETSWTLIEYPYFSTYSVSDDATATGSAKGYQIYLSEDGVTLTLDNVTLEQYGLSFSSNSFTIELKGENETDGISLHPAHGEVTFKGTGTLIIYSPEDYTKYTNIKLQDNLEIIFDGEKTIIKPKATT